MRKGVCLLLRGVYIIFAGVGFCITLGGDDFTLFDAVITLRDLFVLCFCMCSLKIFNNFSNAYIVVCCGPGVVACFFSKCCIAVIKFRVPIITWSSGCITGVLHK